MSDSSIAEPRPTASTIRNTTEQMRDPVEATMFLLNQLASPNPGDPTAAITAMEAQGQRQLVNSDRLPVDMGGSEADFLALGFTFGPPDPDDRLFRPATLPPGWSREPTDHSMWSEIVDELGRKRVGIFYKAAFYDRSAHMSLNTPTGYLRSILWDGGTPVLDDAWLTLEIAAETLEALARQSDKEAAKCDEYAASDPAYWPARKAEHLAEAAKARALAASLVQS